MDLKYEGDKIERLGVTHVINEVILNDGEICMGDESYVDTACVLNINIYLYYEYVKIDGVDLKKI